MKKLTEFLETLFTTANQRIKSPFFGSFIFSWIIINWKPIFYFLFSDDKISIKISNIEKSYESVQNSLVFPLILSLIYVVIFPYVNQLIHLLTIKAEKSKRNVQHNLRKEQIENSQELAEEEKTLEDIRSGNRDISQLNEKINLLNKENERLKETIQNKDEKISEFGEQINGLINDKQTLQNDISKINKRLIDSLDIIPEFYSFKESSLYKYLSDIARELISLPTLPHTNQEIIKDFVMFGIIERDNKNVYSLTNKGKIFLRLADIVN